MVDVVSYKMFAMVVACKKEDGRETIVDQQDVDVTKLQMLMFKLTMCAKSYQQAKIRSVSLLKFRERAVFPDCETS